MPLGVTTRKPVHMCCVSMYATLTGRPTRSRRDKGMSAFVSSVPTLRLWEVWGERNRNCGELGQLRLSYV